MNPLRITTTRGFQIGFIVLLLVSAAQIAYWVWDEVRYSSTARDRLLATYSGEVSAAHELLAVHPAEVDVTALFPALELASPGTVRIRPEVLRALDEEVRSRTNRFVWEGGFFLLVLAAGTFVLTRSLWQQARLRRREENFLAAVSHELKSPLAGIRLGVETMQLRDPEPERRERLLGRILDDVERLEAMISNILDARRIDDGATRRTSGRTSLAEALREVIEESKPLLQRHRSLAIRTLIEEDLDIDADPTAVRTVVRNLLDNARKATARTDPAEITVTAARADGVVRLSVRDNGVGFPPGEAARLFEKFFRLGDEMRRTTAGSGLGLYIVKRHVEIHGGAVTAVSEGEGKGAEFTVTWPASRGTTK